MKKIIYILFFIMLLNPAFSAGSDSFENALSLYNVGEYKAALKMAQNLKAEGVEGAKIALLKYEIYKKQNKNKEAKEELKNALKFDSECYEAAVALIVESINDFDSENAKKYYELAVKIKPVLLDSDYIQYYYAQICVLNKDFEAALVNILSAIETGGDDPLYYLELGKIYILKGEYLHAVNALEYAISKDDILNAEVYNYLGLANYKRQNLKQALKFFKKAVEIQPSIIYLNNLAMTYKSLSDSENYEKVIAEMNMRNPVTAEEYLEFSQYYYNKHEIQTAKQIITEGMRAYPDNILLKEFSTKLNKS